MKPGNIVVFFFARAKAKDRDEWEAQLEKVWPEAVRELQSNPGFLGSSAMWDIDKPGRVAVIGQWESMEHRLAYESRSSPKLREVFNTLFQDIPERPRLVVSQSV
jgi:quinol monooxygenase YgiN